MPLYNKKATFTDKTGEFVQVSILFLRVFHIISLATCIIYTTVYKV